MALLLPLLFAGSLAQAAVPSTVSPGAECLFDWAAKTFAQGLAPAGTPSRVADTRYYRAYTGLPGGFLAVAGGRFYYGSQPSATDAVDLGSLSFWLATANCREAAARPPEVAFTSRSDGAVDAARNGLVEAAFSQPLDPLTLSPGALSVTAEDGRPIAGRLHYDAEQPALVFEPAHELSPGTAYVATVSGKVQSLTGVPLGADYRWRFTVAARRDTDGQRRLQVLLDRAVNAYAIPGAILAVRAADGALWTTTSGYASLDDCTPITPDMRFRIGSNTKTFVATLVLRLVDQGKLGLDDPVDKFLADEMKADLPAYDGGRITIRHLLNHSSGLYNFTMDQDWGQAFVADEGKRYAPEELLRIANRHAGDPKAPVFGSFAYSNTNYVLLGLLLTKLAGHPYEAQLHDLAAQLGLAATYAPPAGTGSLAAPFSHGYWESPDDGALHDVTVRDPSTVWSSGDVVTTIRDLAAWGDMLGPGRLLSPATRIARGQYLDMNDHLQYGLGLVRDRRVGLVGHQGGMIGYTTQVYYLPEKRATFAVFYNRTLPLHDYSDVLTLDALPLLWPDSQAARNAQALPPRPVPEGGRQFCAPTRVSSQ